MPGEHEDLSGTLLGGRYRLRRIIGEGGMGAVCEAWQEDLRRPVAIKVIAGHGAATAITWAGIDSRVAAVVAVAPFASLRDVVPGYLPLPLPKSFADGCIERAGRLGGFDPDRASALDAMATGHAPVLLVHGTKDSRIHFSHSERLAAAAPGRCELHLVPGAGNDSIMGDPDGSIRNLAPSWFTRYLAAFEN